MRTYTIQEALDLPYGIAAENLLEYSTYYGETMSQPYIQANVAFYYSSYYVAIVANYVLYGVVGLIMLIAAFRRFALPHLENKLPVILRRIQLFLRAQLVLSGTFSHRAAEMYGPSWLSMQIPTRLHSIIALAYVLVNVVLLFTPYIIVRPSAWWPEIGWPFQQYLRGFADRTGILAFGSLPLTVILAARNSPITWVTGATFDTLQVYHRWVARVTFMNAAFHTIAYSVSIAMVGSGSLLEYFEDPEESYWWGAGWVAIICGVPLVVLSLRRLREIAYELFLLVHILCGVGWIVGCYYHVFWLDFNDDHFLRWIYAAIAFWAFDRVARGLLLFWLNGPWRLLRRSSSSSAGSRSLFAAEGQLVDAGDYVRLRITPSGSWPAWAGGPGSYVFISSPTWYEGSHPITICWPMHMPAPVDDGDDGDVFEAAASASFELVFKRHAGFTQTTANLVGHSGRGDGALEVASEKRFKPIKMLVEGPYGVGHSVANYDEACVVVGGSGVSAGSAHLADIAKHAARGRLRLRKIVLVWSIRRHSTAEVLAPYLARFDRLMRSHALVLDVHVHITGRATESTSQTDLLAKSATASIDSGGDEKLSINDLADLLGFSSTSTWRLAVHLGRPDVAAYVDALPGGDERTIVTACGPPGLCDATREAVKVRTSRRAETRVQLDYVEEAFNW